MSDLALAVLNCLCADCKISAIAAQLQKRAARAGDQEKMLNHALQFDHWFPVVWSGYQPTSRRCGRHAVCLQLKIIPCSYPVGGPGHEPHQDPTSFIRFRSCVICSRGCEDLPI